jgi:alpha-glucosidase
MPSQGWSPVQLFKIVRTFPVQTVFDSLLHPLRRKYQDLSQGDFGSLESSLAATGSILRRPSPSPINEPLGDIITCHTGDPAPRPKGHAGTLAAVAHNGVDFVATNGVLRLELLAAGLIRLRLRHAGSDDFLPLFSYALDSEATWPSVPFDLEESPAAVTIRTAELVCTVQKSPFCLALYDTAGRLLSDDGAGLGFRGPGAFCTRRLGEGDPVYGLGEKAFDLNLRGRSFEMWNTDPGSYPPGRDPLYHSIPFLVSLHDGQAYGLFFDNPGRARLDLGHTRPELLSYQADIGELCAYLIGGPGISDVLAAYTRLTGRMPLPPRWALGYHQSRWSYYPDSQVRALAAEFRRRQIPCDAIHLDIDYMDGFRVFTWDLDRFPDPPRLLADLHRQGFHTIAIIDPGVKVDRGYAVHDEGLAHGFFCKLPNGRPFCGPVWPGDCYFPDFTDPQVRAWWGELYRPLLDAGLDGFWNDMNEPAIFLGQTMPSYLVHNYGGRGASHGEIHNTYGLQMARAGAEGLRRLRPDERVPLITRSAYAGIQRHALAWTGDNWSTWAHLRLGVSMCLNLGLSGVAFCGPDIGGFAGDCDGELLARWTQVGALTPFFRNHAATGSRQQEPWAFAEPYESICRRWIELRYELLPYVYTAAWQAAQSGTPMMRPLALAFPTDRRTYSLDDQFLFGDALLAAPVGYPGQVCRRLYLPEGTWYDFWTGETYRGAGDQVEVAAPLERMPIFVRAGSVLPMAPVMQHTGEWPPPALHLHIYPGDGESRLYEDDGHSRAYQTGEFRLTRFTCKLSARSHRREGSTSRRPSTSQLTLHRIVTGPFDPGYDRFEIHLHALPSAFRQVLVDGQPVDTTFDPERNAIRLEAGDWTLLEAR